MSFTSEQKRFYLEEGHLLVKNLLDADSLNELSRDLGVRVDKTVQKLHIEGRLNSLCEEVSFERRLVALCRAAKDENAVRDLWQSVELKYFDIPTNGMFRMMTHPALLDVVESIIGPEILFHPQSNVCAKLPRHDESMVPWHQDSVGLAPESEKTFIINFWIPLVEVTMDMGGMQVMRGPYHKGPELSETFAIPESKLPKDEIVDCPVPRGGALMIQKRTIHRSVPNVSDKARWSMDFRFSPADKPAGRPGGFVIRSRSKPETVVRRFEDYLKIVPHLRTVWVP